MNLIVIFICFIIIFIVISHYWNNNYDDNYNDDNYSNNSSSRKKSYKKKNKKWYDTYYEKLLHDERWINKRNEILKRYNYKCTYCGSSNKLQIHHLLYYKYPNDKLVNPWDYPNDKLRTLCDRCHKKQHKKVKTKIYYVPYNYDPLTHKSKYNSNLNDKNKK